MFPTRRDLPGLAWQLALVVGLPLLAMALLGLDGNWDLRNYHLYNPHAWLTGRDAIDIAPAQLQSFHNPLLDVPLYLIVQSGAPMRLASLWLLVPTMLALALLLRLQRALAVNVPGPSSQLALVVLALTGAAAYSTLALSMNDAFTAAGMLGALALVVRAEPLSNAGGNAVDRAASSRTHRRWLFAGIVAGAFAGLKLSSAFYCVALACAACVNDDWRSKRQRLAWLAAGGIGGFAATYGFWAWRLWKAHGNPVFPYYNQFFLSPDALPVSWADGRFRPQGVVDMLLAPLHLLSKSSNFSEIPLKDPRLLIALLGFAGLAFLHRHGPPRLKRNSAVLLVFVLASFALWAAQYGIYRYLIVLEMLGCLALVLLVQQLHRGQLAALLLAVLVVSADTRRPDWVHLPSIAPRMGIPRMPLPGNSIVVTASGEPMAYLALALPDDVPLIAVANNLMEPGRCTRMQRRAEKQLRTHVGPIWLLSTPDVQNGRDQAAISRTYLLHPSGACLPVVTALDNATLCPQVRDDSVPQPVSACPTP